jgi:hypothetical protein
MSTQRYTVPERSNIKSTSTNELDPFMYGEVDNYLVDNLDDFNVPFNFTEELTENDRVLVPTNSLKIQTSTPKQVYDDQAQNIINTFTDTVDTILNNIGITSSDTSPRFTKLSPRQSPVRQSPRITVQKTRQSPVRQSPRITVQKTRQSPVRQSPRTPVQKRQSPRTTESPTKSQDSGKRELPMKSPRESPREYPKESPKESPRTSPRKSLENGHDDHRVRIVAINIPERDECIFATVDSENCPQLNSVRQSPRITVQKTRQSPVRQSPRRSNESIRQSPRSPVQKTRQSPRTPESPIRQSPRTPVQTRQSPVRQSPRMQSPRTPEIPRMQSNIQQSPRTLVQTPRGTSRGRSAEQNTTVPRDTRRPSNQTRRRRPQSPVRQSPINQDRTTGSTSLPLIDTVFEPERFDLSDSEVDSTIFNSIDQFLSNIPENSIIERDNNVMYLSPETPVPASPTFGDLVSSGPIVISTRNGEINIRRLDNDFLTQIQDNLDDISRQLLSSIRLDNDQNNLWETIITAINDVFNRPIIERRDNS